MPVFAGGKKSSVAVVVVLVSIEVVTVTLLLFDFADLRATDRKKHYDPRKDRHLMGADREVNDWVGKDPTNY